MYLKSLSIKGFKSFARKTMMDFEPGITMIVGPNGSGKSNVVDAIQWVLGEQSPSQLRGSAMKDVIFAGTESVKPLSVCEISLVLDNSKKTIPIDYSEINITRRMLRTGENNYFINDTSCRLIDVFELLSDSGLGRNTHSIIAQGKIDQIINCKPEERRHLIEEAAGVLKHKKRKERSLRKLVSVDENLNRVKDILREVKKQTGPLRNQIEKAKEYKNAEKRLKDIKIAKTVKQLNRLKERFEQIESERESFAGMRRMYESQLIEKRDQLKKAELELEDLQKKYAQENKRYIKQMELKSSYEKAKLIINQKITNLKEKIDNLENSTQSANQQINVLQGKKEHLFKERENLEKEINRVYKRLKNVQKKASETKLSWKKQHDETISKEAMLKQSKDEIIRQKENSVNLSTSLNTCKEKIEFIKKEIEKIDEEASLAASLETENEEQLKNEDIKAIEVKNGIDLLESKKQKNKEETSLINEQIKEQESKFNRAISRKEALEEAFNLSDQTNKGTLLLEDITIEDGFKKAFEAAMSSYHNLMLASNMKDMNRKSQDASPGQKILNLSYRASISKGDERALINKIKAPRKTRNALAILLENVYVAESINEIDNTRDWVLRDGTVYKHGVLCIPGEVNIENEYASLIKIIQETRDKISSLDEKIQILRDEMSRVKESINQERNYFSEIREIISGLNQNKKTIEKSKESFINKKEELSRSLAIDKLSYEKLNQQYQVIVKLVNDKRAEIKELEVNIIPVDKELEQKRLSFEKEVHDIKLNLASLNERLLFIKQQENENEINIRNSSENLKENNDTVQKTNQILSRLKILESCYGKLQVITEIPYQTRASDFSNEKQIINDLREACKEIEQKQSDVSRKNEKSKFEEVEIKAKVDSITEKIIEDFQVSLENALKLSDLEYENDEISILEQLIKNMGPINFAAFDQFEKLKDREVFLEKQIEDLMNSKKSLRRIIKSIDKKIEEDMIDSFELVKMHFEKMFTLLFPGGRSNLYLTDEEDILNTGVELEVQPAGKKLSKLSLLSGGETALTALALLFAIYHARPSPFYVLDEVEAALDDINLQRFIRLIEDMRIQTQFLVITHQKRTMEIADCLYGVSMQADGISRVLSQKLEKIPEVEEVEIA